MQCVTLIYLPKKFLWKSAIHHLIKFPFDAEVAEIVNLFDKDVSVWLDKAEVVIVVELKDDFILDDTLNVWDGEAVVVLVVEPDVREDVRVDDIIFDTVEVCLVEDPVTVMVVNPDVLEDFKVDDVIFDRDVMSGILELLSVWYEDAVIDVEWDPVELSTNSWSWSIVSSRSSFVSRRESFKEFKALRSIVVHESTVLLSICDANNSIVDTWDKSLEIESNVVTTATNSEQDKIFITLWFKTSLIWFVTFSIEDVILSRFSILFIIWDWLMVVETEFVKVEYVELVDPGKVKDVCGCEFQLVDLNLVLLLVEVVEWEIAMGFSGDLVGKIVEECVKPTHCKYCKISKLLKILIYMIKPNQNKPVESFEENCVLVDELWIDEEPKKVIIG